MAERTAADTLGEPPAAILDRVLDSAEARTFLRSTMDAMVEELGGAGREMGWAVTVLRGGTTGTWMADNDRTAAADRLQHLFDDGPALAAIRHIEFVHVGDIGLERRWPGYAHAVAGYGVLSLLAVPMIPDKLSATAVTLYAASPHAFSSEDITTARGYAGQGVRGLRLALELSQKKEATAARSPVPGPRNLIGSALRILMEEYRLSYEAAFHYLQAAARSRSIGFEQAALDIVTAGPPPRPHPGTLGAISAPARHSATGGAA